MATKKTTTKKKPATKRVKKAAEPVVVQDTFLNVDGVPAFEYKDIGTKLTQKGIILSDGHFDFIVLVPSTNSAEHASYVTTDPTIWNKMVYFLQLNTPKVDLPTSVVATDN